MELKIIDKKTFDNFAYNHPKAHFMQTSPWGEVAMKRHMQAYLLGLYDQEKLKAVALFLEKKLLNYSYFYCPRGFLIDYDDRALLKVMVEECTKFAKKHHALYFKIDPDIIVRKHGAKGETIFEDKAKLELIDTLSKMGGRHKGFTTRFADSSNPRFTFRLNLDADMDSIVAHFHPTLRNIIKRQNPFDLDIYKGDEKDVRAFYETMEETSKRKEIVLEPYSFFADFYNILNHYGMSDIYLAKLNVHKLKNYYQNKKNELEKALLQAQEPTATLRQKKELGNLEDQLKKVNKEAAAVDEIKTEEIVLSAVITAKYKDKVWIVHGGNRDILKFVNANYELYYRIICDAKAQGYHWVDFFGAEGNVDQSSNLYGITMFKMRFGGDFDEFIGEFDFILKPLVNKLLMTLVKARRRYYIKKAEHQK